MVVVDTKKLVIVVDMVLDETESQEWRTYKPGKAHYYFEGQEITEERYNQLNEGFACTK